MEIAGSNSVLQQATTDILVQLVCAGDAAATCELIGRYERLAYRTSFSILKNREDAEDAVQEASLRVFQKIQGFQGQSAFTTWFTSIVINTSLMQLRKRRRRPASSLDDLVGESGSDSLALRHPGASPEQECCGKELKSVMRAAIQNLPDRLREVARDRFFEDLPIADLAQRRGLTLTAAKSRVFRARRIIVDNLRQSA